MQGISRKDGARSALFLISELCCSMYCFVSIMCCSIYSLFVLFYVLFVCKCVLLPPGVNPIAVKYVISYQESPELSAEVKRPGHESSPPSAQLTLKPLINSPNASQAFWLIYQRYNCGLSHLPCCDFVRRLLFVVYQKCRHFEAVFAWRSGLEYEAGMLSNLRRLSVCDFHQPYTLERL
jgi:hypothetical protein